MNLNITTMSATWASAFPVLAASAGWPPVLSKLRRCAHVLSLALLLAGCGSIIVNNEANLPKFRTLSVAFSPDGAQIAGGTPLTAAVLFDAQSQQMSGAIVGEKRRFMSVKSGGVVTHDFGLPLAYSPDGRWLATGGTDFGSAVELWSPKSGAKIMATCMLPPANCRPDFGQRFYIRSLAFSPDSSRLAVASGGRVNVIDPLNGGSVQQWKAHDGETIALAYTPEGSAIVSGGDDGTVRFWNSQTFELLKEVDGFAGAVTGIAFAPDGRRMAVSAGGYELRLFDTGQGQQQASTGQALTVPAPSATQGSSSAAQGILQLLAVMGSVRQAQLVGAPAPILNVGAPQPTRAGLKPRICDAQVAFSPDGMRVAHATKGSVSITNLSTNTTVTQKNANDLACSVSFSPDGKRVAAGGGDETTGGIRLYDAASGSLIPPVVK